MLAAHNIATYNSFACYYNIGGQMGYILQPTVRQWHSTSTTRYYAPSFEREITNGQTTDYTYIESPNGLVAAVKRAGNKQDVMLLATDHLGSIVGVWNAQGTLLEEHRYSAWGLRTSSTASPRLRRGFTGHEHLPQFGLIDMQARLYAPHLGRFLAPDPYVQAPDNHLSLNRYAYCMYNPLKYVDPTGEFCIGAAIFIGGFINFAIQGITNNINSFGDCVKAWTIGGLAGLIGAAAGAAVAGAINVSGFLGGAAVGAAGGAAGGFVGGAGEAWLSGESLGDGLKQGLIGAGIGAVSGGLIGGVIGGIEAAVDGRNFWHGERLLEDVSLPMKQVNQDPKGDGSGQYDCPFACAESVESHYGGERTLQDLKNNYFDYNIPEDYRGVHPSKFGKLYGKSGYTASEITLTYKTPIDVVNEMMGKLRDGVPVQFNYNTGVREVVNGKVFKYAHATIVNRIRLYDNGRFVINVMNLNIGGGTRFHSLRRLNLLFSILKY